MARIDPGALCERADLIREQIDANQDEVFKGSVRCEAGAEVVGAYHARAAHRFAFEELERSLSRVLDDNRQMRELRDQVERALDALAGALTSDSDAEVREAAAWALGRARSGLTPDQLRAARELQEKLAANLPR